MSTVVGQRSAKHSLGRLARVALLTLLILYVVLYTFFHFGYSFARSEGISMEPYLKDGDALVMRQVSPKGVHVGDVVWINRRGTPILHRVIQQYSDQAGVTTVVTKGDNAPFPERPIAASQIKARVVFKIPGIGAGSRLVGLRDGYQFVVMVAFLVLLASALARLALRRPVRS